jgi:L-lactate dehydrogenase complex protein LldE
MRVSLFMPCFNDAIFPRTGKATVRILERLGHEVDFPEDQTCCGQIHLNTGYRREARALMERFLRVFRNAEKVVAPSASCVAMVREQFGELAAESGEPGLEGDASAMRERVFELTEFLVKELGVDDLGAVFPYRVAYHPTCHSMRSIDVGNAPVRLLRKVQGIELVELPGADECCGFGGTFALKNADTSLAMLGDKVRSVWDSGAQVLTAVDNSCLLHLAGGLHRIEAGAASEGLDPPPPSVLALHVAEILASGWS